MIDMETIGRRMRVYRMQAGLTMAQLAKLVGCSFQAIGTYERAEREPSLIVAYNIAQALGITLDQLIAEKVVVEI